MRKFVTLLASTAIAGTTALAAPQRGDTLRTDFVQTHQERSDAIAKPLTPEQARAELAEQLVRHGVTPAEAKARADAMTDTEAQELAAHFDAAPAGGDSTITIGIGTAIIIALLLVIFL